MRIAVVGAGPAGLWAAWQAAQAGHEVTVLERAGHVGGLAASIEVAGLRVDLGSHRLHPSTPPAILRGLGDLLGDDLQVRPRHGRIRLAGRWLGFPLRATDLVRHTPPSFAAGAVADAVGAPFRRPQADSFAEVVRAGLGPTVFAEFYRPYVTKIWGVDPAELSGDLARRRVSASSPTDIARRLVRGARPGGRTFLYPRRGFGQISEALADAAVAAGADIRLGTELRSLDGGDEHRPARLTLAPAASSRSPNVVPGPPGTGSNPSVQNLRRFCTDGPGLDEPQVSGGVGDSSSSDWAASPSKPDASADVSGFDADLVFSTVPLADLARRSAPAPAPETLAAAGRLEHRGLVLVYLALPTRHWSAFDAHYLPGPDQLAARLSEPRNYRESAADPDDVTVLCAEVPATVGDATWVASDDDLAARLIEDLARLGLPPIRPVEVRTVRLPRVYPVYRPGFEWDLVALEWWLADQPQVVSFGRQGLFVPDNTHHALAMADAAVRSIGPSDGFDHRAWAGALETFRTHVVED